MEQIVVSYTVIEKCVQKMSIYRNRKETMHVQKKVGGKINKIINKIINVRKNI